MKPFCGVTVKVNVALPPAVTVALDGFAEMVKSPAVVTVTTCWIDEDVEALSNVSPRYCAAIE